MLRQLVTLVGFVMNNICVPGSYIVHQCSVHVHVSTASVYACTCTCTCTHVVNKVYLNGILKWYVWCTKVHRESMPASLHHVWSLSAD